MLVKSSASRRRHKMGQFTIIPNLPGEAVPDHNDHGYGPLARFDESILEPGAFIPMHEHSNDEIISYMSDGTMFHADRAGGRFPVNASQIMVMNAGKSFWHEEGVPAGGETARMMQIFVRPHTVDLEPTVQLKDKGAPTLDTWRFLVGPEGSDAPAIVRNDVRLYDIHLKAGSSTQAPRLEGWDTLVHAYRGEAVVNGTPLKLAEGALLIDEAQVEITATSNATLLVFLINRAATLTHAGTIAQ